MLNKILYIGVTPSLDDYLRDKVYLANVIALLLQLLGISYAIISALFAPKVIWLPIIGGNFCGGLVFLLNYLGKYTFSRVLVSICPSMLAALYISCIVQDGEAIINSLYLVMVIFGLFIFLVVDQREPKILIPLMVYTGLLFFFFDKLVFWVDVPMSSTIFRTPWMDALSYLIGIGMMLLLMWFLLKKNLMTEKENLNLIQALEEQKYEITAQNEELYQQQEEMQAQQDFIAYKNNELSRKNKLIQNSIQAASAIQQAVLPGHQQLRDYFKDYFLIYRPRDVVSGDFYWVGKQGAYTFLIAVDCTGHGVPGAFMTLIATNLLDRIIRIESITDAATILNLLHKEVKRVLRQKETQNNNGMDAVVIRSKPLPDQNTEVQMAGAKNGFFYKVPEERALVEVKGTRKSIGGFQNESIEFEATTLVLSQNSTLYVGSDGFEDQNNFQRKKFTRRRLRQILEEHTHLGLNKQKEVLENALNTHMNHTKQRDDILWMGIRL